MIKFFRKIRQKLLTDPTAEQAGNKSTSPAGRFSKYLIYAIGEIILVVIGIFIALSINDWNDGRKNDKLMGNYIESSKKDLAADKVYFITQIEMDSIDLVKMQSISDRLSNSFTTIDTLIKIARFEFLPFTDIKNALNMSTYNSLIATGNIDIFDADISESLLKFNTLQLNSNSLINRNDEFYFNSVGNYRIKYPYNSSRNGINGSFMDSFWMSLDENELKSEFNGVLTAKLSMLANSILDRKEMLLSTEDMLKTLNDIEH